MSPEQAVLNDQLILGAVVFCVGVVGIVVRRNLISMILGSQVALQGVWISLVAASSFHRDADGFAWGMLLAVVPIVQVLLGVSLAVVFIRRAGSWDIAIWQRLRETESTDAEPTITSTTIDHV